MEERMDEMRDDVSGAMGETQSFNAAIESDVLSEIEVIEKLNG